MRQVILASNSPRRRELMKFLGIPFEVMVSDFDEASVKTKNPKKLVETLSRSKTEKVAQAYKDAIVIGADTEVVLKGKVLGKPKDSKDAERTLLKLSGTRHSIITGFTVMDTKTGEIITESIVSYVLLKKLSIPEIRAYIKTGEPMDKAGSYAVNERGGLFVDQIHGDFFSIVGLPLKRVRELLLHFKVKLPV